jgi:hypothetical protein
MLVWLACVYPPNETHDDGHDAESHQDTVWNVCQVDGKSSKLRVMYEDKEQDQANQGSHQKQQPKE